MLVYECYVVDGFSGSYIPGEYLLPGRQVSRMASAYEEYSDEEDIINYQTPFKMRNNLMTLRLGYDITGDAYSTVLAIALKDPETGKTSYLWSDYQYWLALREWGRDVRRRLSCSVSLTVTLMVRITSKVQWPSCCCISWSVRAGCPG